MATKINTKTTIKPLFDNVLIKPLGAQTKTASGIYIPETAKEKPQVGEIMAIGPGVTDKDGKLIPMIVHVGEKVMYKKWGGNEIKVGEGMDEWVIVEQKDILAITE